MKKHAVLLVVTILVAVLMAQEGPILPVQAQDEVESSWVCPAGFEGQTLRIFNWSTYIAEDTVPNFEKACGVTVEYFEYGSNDEMINIVRAGTAQYDLVFPTSNAVTRMIEEGLIQKLDHSLIPNLKNLAPTFENRPHDPGNLYSVPYQWGTVGIGVDTTVVDPDQFKTWADFFNYTGRVAWIEEQRIVMGIVLTMLGYDPNTTNEAEINAAADFLINDTQNDLYQIAQDNGQDLLVQGEVDAVIEYNGDIFQIANECECDDFAFIVPPETNLWMDGIAIPYNAPNPKLAHAFIDYILDPVVGASISNYIQYASPNAAALPYIDASMRDNAGIYPSDDILSTTFIVLDTGEAETFYSAAWNRVSAALAD